MTDIIVQQLTNQLQQAQAQNKGTTVQLQALQNMYNELNQTCLNLRTQLIMMQEVIQSQSAEIKNLQPKDEPLESDAQNATIN